LIENDSVSFGGESDDDDDDDDSDSDDGDDICCCGSCCCDADESCAAVVDCKLDADVVQVSTEDADVGEALDAEHVAADNDKVNEQGVGVEVEVVQGCVMCVRSRLYVALQCCIKALLVSMMAIYIAPVNRVRGCAHYQQQ
jgi:hypothetical protein